MTAETSLYLIALGSNVRHGLIGNPAEVVREAGNDLSDLGRVTAFSSIVSSDPVGPSNRRYANAAALLETNLNPPVLLTALKAIERRFGIRRGGRWRARVLDLDIILWSGGMWNDGRDTSPQLTIPHPLFRERAFVLAPAAQIAPHWRDPKTNLSLRQLKARLTRPRPILR